MLKLTAIYEKTEDGWWVGTVEEVPGTNTQGRTLEEVRENLQEALQLVLETNRELAENHLAGRSVIRESLAIA